ncbi:MAG: YobA family protein [Acidimicrobiales bacterium]|jgi:hypothetical protein|nr:YobA family protein [Acidimicrobiales bacterium]
MSHSPHVDTPPRRVHRSPSLLVVLALVLAVALAGALPACSADDGELGTGPGSNDTTSTTADGTAPDGTSPAVLPGRDPDLVGTITALSPFQPVTEDCTPPEDLDPDGVVSSDDPPVCTDPDTDVLGTILVEAEPGAQTGVLGDKASLTVTTATAIGVCGPTDARIPGSFEDVTVGQTVLVWSDGPVAESYPVQATANALALGVCG